MSRTKIVLPILIVLLAALSFSLIEFRQIFSLKPFASSAEFKELADVSPDGEGGLYLISDTKQRILHLDAAGRLVGELRKQRAAGGGLTLFSDLASDDQGNLYVLQTELDSYGLFVQSEQIIHYDKRGRQAGVLLNRSYTPADRLLRVGVVKALTVRGDQLEYFTVDKSGAAWHQVSLSGGPARTGFTLPLPADHYLSDVSGNQSGQVYYTNKKGELLQLADSGRTNLLYPRPGMDRGDLNMPQGLGQDASGRLYFIDMLRNEVSRLVPSQPYVVETPLSQAKLAAAPGPDNVSRKLGLLQNLFVGADGSVAAVTESQVLEIGAGGQITKVQDRYYYTGGLIAARAGYWVMLAAAVALLLFTVRYVYIHVLNRRLSLMVKQIGVFIPLMVLCMGALAGVVYQMFTIKLEDEVRKELILLAHNGNNLVDGNALERLKSPQDYMNADYTAIKAKMNGLFDREGDDFNRDGLYSTLYKYENNSLFVIMDDDDSVKMFSSFPMDDDNRKVVQFGNIITGQMDNASGSWFYAVGPIKNDQGQIVGLYETGKDMNGVKQHSLKVLSNILWMIAGIALVMLIVFCLMTFLMLSSLRRLNTSVIQIASGRWDTTVDIRTRDEVADLGERFNEMAAHIRSYIGQMTRLSEAYYRFVPQQFLRTLGKDSILDVELGDQSQREMTLLVSSTRNFYQMSRKLTPFENFNFINSFLKRFSPVVHKHDGMINKYLGAGFLALYPHFSEKAIYTAVEMRRMLEVYNTHRANSRYAPIDVGLAIHKGALMLGVIGEEQRMEGSVISEHVGLVQELEKATARLGVSILVTEEALGGINRPYRFQLRSLGRVQLHGEERAITLYDVFEGDSEEVAKLKKQTKDRFEQAVLLYQAGRFFDARESFVEVIRMNRWDEAAKLYFYACDEFFQNGAPADFDGTLKL
ncbi:HAMP domain-containing protein [Paenibacillus sp. y28]|uniref:HAMP domain-containing protein n=1 Tax=Paenibacillus sp. y28 TaxID=3129110 RepID=UPI00301B1ED7